MKKKNKRKHTLKREQSIGKLRKKKKKSGKNDLDNGFKVLMMDKNDNLNIQTKEDIPPLVTTNDVLNLKCNGNPKENNEGEVNFEEDGAKKATDDEKNGSMDASISEPVYADIEEVSTKKILIIDDEYAKSFSKVIGMMLDNSKKYVIEEHTQVNPLTPGKKITDFFGKFSIL
ncbi:hypothetical protein JTB14_001033 [Gonioctena quinquepunctata]|nr:hypothetical protein JTB14_001033 [Gonioctena quinquepunctata]